MPLLDIKVHTQPHDITTDYTLLQHARATAQDTEGVTRLIGLVSAEKTYDMRTGGHCIVFRFNVETTLAPWGSTPPPARQKT